MAAIVNLEMESGRTLWVTPESIMAIEEHNSDQDGQVDAHDPQLVTLLVGSASFSVWLTNEGLDDLLRLKGVQRPDDIASLR